MLHRRTYQIADVPDLDQLATQLARFDWCGCQGFRYRGLLWLNDSTGPDGAQEYAVVEETTCDQIESLTVSWMSYERLRQTLEALANGHGWQRMGTAVYRAQTPDTHGRCPLCA